jgi:hypothetical protein
MGFSDKLIIARAYPEFGLQAGTEAQTTSLYAGGSLFTITGDGKLVEHLSRYDDDSDAGGTPRFKRVHIGDQVIPYHGDILLHIAGADERFHRLVARFTHGQLEWLRPFEEYPEANRQLLIEQGAR